MCCPWKPIWQPFVYMLEWEQSPWRSVLVVNQALVPRVWSEITNTSSLLIVPWIKRTYRNWTSAYICTYGVVQVRILHWSSFWRISEIWMKCFLIFFPEVRECLKWRTMLTCTVCGNTFTSPEESRTTSGYMDSGPMHTLVTASRWIIMMVNCVFFCLSVCLSVCLFAFCSVCSYFDNPF